MKLSRRQIKATKWLIERYKSVTIEELKKQDAVKLFRIDDSCVLCTATVPRINSIMRKLRRKLSNYTPSRLDNWIIGTFPLNNCKKCVWQGRTKDSCECAFKPYSNSFQDIYYGVSSESKVQACRVRAGHLEEQLNKLSNE